MRGEIEKMKKIVERISANEVAREYAKKKLRKLGIHQWDADYQSLFVRFYRDGRNQLATAI